ncbi:unnamed protein product [Hermetia illucens]|uniref:Transmembrane protein n=1 Tax=Hermetia illucens TaxID=343691 RepID=A0A7R8V017_HERIL|nr:transmembrane protein 17A-like [Hermetia illucens]CAD7090202.1 unnamed protein product [Hermetia illucens]
MSNEKYKTRTGWKDVQQVSSLPLQIFLFVNVYVSAIWLVVHGNYVYEMVNTFGMIQRTLTIMASVIAMPGEVLRLYLGYSGNLGGKISDLAGFWILSTLVQLPIQLYFTLTAADDWILIVYLQYLLVCLLLFEIPTGGYASNKLSKHQSQQYRIQLIGKMHKNS